MGDHPQVVEGRRAILRQRARRLARETTGFFQTTETPNGVLFRLDGETYAIEAIHVVEVLSPANLVQLPGAPPYVMGVFGFRGRVVSVVDIRQIFGQAPREATGEELAIVLEGGDMEFALQADEVTGVTRLSEVVCQAPEIAPNGMGSSYIQGITEERIVLLDARAILQDEELAVDTG